MYMQHVPRHSCPVLMLFKQGLQTVLLLMLLTVSYPVWHPAYAAEPSPTDVLGAVEKATRAEQQSQRLADKWTQEKETLLRTLRDLRTREEWLAFQLSKYRSYIATQKSNIAELQRREEELQTVRDRLEPFLKEIVDRVEASLADGLPTLADERAQRIAFLKDSLADYHLTLSEKLRRVLEALQVEAEYGKSVETSDTTILLDGVQTRVTLLRMGRLAVFHATADGSRMGYWDRTDKQWKALDEAYHQDLLKGLEMANRRKVVELLRLPVESESNAQPEALQ